MDGARKECGAPKGPCGRLSQRRSGGCLEWLVGWVMFVYITVIVCAYCTFMVLPEGLQSFSNSRHGLSEDNMRSC